MLKRFDRADESAREALDKAASRKRELEKALTKLDENNYAVKLLELEKEAAHIRKLITREK